MNELLCSISTAFDCQKLFFKYLKTVLIDKQPCLRQSIKKLSLNIKITMYNKKMMRQSIKKMDETNVHQETKDEKFGLPLQKGRTPSFLKVLMVQSMTPVYGLSSLPCLSISLCKKENERIVKERINTNSFRKVLTLRPLRMNLSNKFTT